MFTFNAGLTGVCHYEQFVKLDKLFWYRKKKKDWRRKTWQITVFNSVFFLVHEGAERLFFFFKSGVYKTFMHTSDKHTATQTFPFSNHLSNYAPIFCLFPIFFKSCGDAHLCFSSFTSALRHVLLCVDPQWVRQYWQSGNHCFAILLLRSLIILEVLPLLRHEWD